VPRIGQADVVPDLQRGCVQRSSYPGSWPLGIWRRWRSAGYRRTCRYLQTRVL